VNDADDDGESNGENALESGAHHGFASANDPCASNHVGLSGTIRNVDTHFSSSHYRAVEEIVSRRTPSV
jgi:hypothetical protein